MLSRFLSTFRIDLMRQLSKQVSIVEEKAAPEEPAGALIIEEKAEVGMVSQA